MLWCSQLAYPSFLLSRVLAFVLRSSQRHLAEKVMRRDVFLLLLIGLHFPMVTCAHSPLRGCACVRVSLYDFDTGGGKLQITT